MVALQQDGASVNAVGALNTFGLTGTYWFEYGGASTPSQQAEAATIPQTVTTTLSGLLVNQPTSVLLACQTSAGVVYSSPVVIVYEPGGPVVAPSPIVSAPSVSTPHLVYPFTIGLQGALVAEQDSYEEEVSCVRAVVACMQGECPELPTFGITDPTFRASPPNVDDLLTQIQTWEPRVTEASVLTAVNSSNADWDLNITPSVSNTGG